jgi:ubiquitin-conjugating enzyme E2 O
MDVKQVRVHDLVRKVNSSHLGLVDRTDKEVNSHVPRPQADYIVDIQRHRSVSKDDFRIFMRHGKVRASHTAFSWSLWLTVQQPPLRTALVYWDFGASVELISTRFLEVINRTIECGEVVKKVGESRAAMSGVVIEREVFHTLGVINSQYQMPILPNLKTGVERCFPRRLENVSGNNIAYSRPYVRGDVVLYDGWFGDVYDVFEEAVVCFHDGRLIAFEDISGIQNIRPDPNCVGELLDVGYIVQASHTFIAAKGRLVAPAGGHLHYPIPSNPRGVVCQIKVNSIEVNWRGRRLGDVGALNQPHPVVDFSVVQRSQVRRYAYSVKLRPENYIAGKMDAEFGLGTDVKFRSGTTSASFPLQSDPSHAVPVVDDASLGDPSDGGQPVRDEASRLDQEADDLNTFVVIGVSSKITVRWQDQSVSSHASKDLLADEEFEDNHELWPYCLVAPLPAAPVSQIWRPSRIGVVQSVVSSDRIAQVLWKNTQEISYSTSQNQQPILLPRDAQSIFPLNQGPGGNSYPEEVSLYDVGHLPDMSLQILDLVMVIPTDTGDSATVDGPSGTTQSEAMYDWIGHVVDRKPDGMVVVRMGALRIPEDRLCPPDRLQFLLSREDVLDLVEGTESADEHSDESLANDEENNAEAPIAVWYENDQGERISPAVSEEDGWSTADDSREDAEMEDVGSEGGAAAGDESAGDVQAPQSQQNGHMDTSEEATVEVVETPSNGAQRPRRLSIRGGPPLFDVLDSDPPSTHAFIADDTVPLAGTQMRRIRKEHSILSSSLPEGVYVRSWASRLDLFRVVIIGPPDTPYEYAPFMIDFQLPGDFPNKPPKAFFQSWHSGTSAINPNLYQDGKICLSLLNT